MSPKNIHKHKWFLNLHQLFELAILIKGVDGVLELTGGILLVSMNQSTMDAVVIFLTQHEFSFDHHDIFMTHAIQIFRQFTSGSRMFGTFFLIGHGFIKIWLMFAVWQNKLWAYPIAIGFFLLFISYQSYRLTHSHSWTLAFFTILDMIIVVLVWREYIRLVKARKQ